LDLSYNQLTKLSKLFLTTSAENLRLLFLSHNRMKSLSRHLRLCTSLHVLKLDHNCLEKIGLASDGWKQLRQLIFLDLQKNCIDFSGDDSSKDFGHQIEILVKNYCLRFLSVYKNANNSEETFAIIPKNEEKLTGDTCLVIKRYLQNEEITLDKLHKEIPLPKRMNLRLSKLQTTPTGRHENITRLAVYRQWDHISCGYHALKNTVLALVTLQLMKNEDVHHLAHANNINKEENEKEESERKRALFFLEAMQSPVHFWVLYCYWQHALLQISRKQKSENKKTMDCVWKKKKIYCLVLWNEIILSIYSLKIRLLIRWALEKIFLLFLKRDH